jgi:hypothetical protein
MRKQGDLLLKQSEAGGMSRRHSRCPRPAFRSSYEDGIRDVRRLYPKAFYG